MNISDVLISLSAEDIFYTIQYFINKNRKLKNLIILNAILINENKVEIQGKVNALKIPINITCSVNDFEINNNILSATLNINQPSIFIKQQLFLNMLYKFFNKKLSKYEYITILENKIILNLNYILSKISVVKIKISNILIDDEKLKIELINSKVNLSYI